MSSTTNKVVQRITRRFRISEFYPEKKKSETRNLKFAALNTNPKGIASCSPGL
jgi:hypothetical protein